MARRGDEGEAEALEVVMGARQGGDLELAAVARAGVHLTDRQRPAESAVDLTGQARADALDVRSGRGRLGDDPGPEGHAELA